MDGVRDRFPILISPLPNSEIKDNESKDAIQLVFLFCFLQIYFHYIFIFFRHVPIKSRYLARLIRFHRIGQRRDGVCAIIACQSTV